MCNINSLLLLYETINIYVFIIFMILSDIIKPIKKKKKIIIKTVTQLWKDM